MKNLPTLLATASLALLANTMVVSDAYAWGAQGHRLVGRVAETGLSPTARAEVDRLLAGEPVPSLAAIAPWADELRANDPDLGKRSANWHYVNMAEDGCAYQAARHCPDGNCVVEALKQQSALLANHKLPDAARLQALKFVVHLVGDIHQPCTPATATTAVATATSCSSMIAAPTCIRCGTAACSTPCS